MQDDMHVFRLSQFIQCFQDGQIPCRLIKLGGFGYSYPLFNFYPPFFYALASTFSLFHLSLITSLKVSLLLLNSTAIIFTYLLLLKLSSKKFLALTLTILYAFFPYRAVDLFVRGAMAEFTALSLLPLVVYTYLNYKQQKTKLRFLFSSLSLTAFFLSHNLISFLSLPLLLFFSLWPSFKFKLKNFWPLLLALGLSAFFLIPAIFESHLTTIKTMTQGYFDYKAHFIGLKQLFIDRSWGYGASLWGPKDDMSFQLGTPHQLIYILSITISFYWLLHKKYYSQKTSVLVFFNLFYASIALFMTHNRSIFIWKLLPFLAFVQFPWRFIGLSLLPIIITSSLILSQLKLKKSQTIVYTIVILSSIIFNFNYFKEDIYFPNLTDQQKLTQAEIIRQSGAGLKDYWPNYGLQFPDRFSEDRIISNLPIKISNYQRNSYQLSASLDVSQNNSLITLPIVYFPNWKIYLDNQPQTIQTDTQLGLIQLKSVVAGQHQLKATFTNTPIRNLANLISLTCLFLLPFFYLKINQPK